MRITFLLPYAPIGGGARVVSIYADYLQRFGHEVAVVSLPNTKRRFSYGKFVKRAGSWSTPPPYFENTSVSHHVIDRVRPINDKDVPDADVIIATWWETAEWVAALSPEKGKKAYLVQDHETFPGQPIERVRATYLLPLHKIAVSAWLRDLMRDRYQSPATSLVENAVDGSFFQSVDRTKNVTPTIGFVYSDAIRKRSDIAIRALQLSRALLPDLRATSFGSAQSQSDLPLPGWIEYHFAPPQPRLPLLYGSCDAWLFTSETEGFGLPILEAMSCGTPMISSRAAAAPQLIDSSCGFFVDLSADAFAQTIVEIALMPADRWGEMSKSARARAQKRDWGRASLELESILKGLLAG